MEELGEEGRDQGRNADPLREKGEIFPQEVK